MFEDRLHDLAYDVEDDKYLQKFYYIYDMQLDLHYDLIHVDVNHPIWKYKKISKFNHCFLKHTLLVKTALQWRQLIKFSVCSGWHWVVCKCKCVIWRNSSVQ